MKKKLLFSGLALASLAPLASAISCGSSDITETLTYFYDNKTDLSEAPVVAQSFEPIDFLATLGKKPDYSTNRSDQGVYMPAMPEYLKGRIPVNQQPKPIDMKVYDWYNKAAFNPSTMLNNIGGKKGVMLTYQSLHLADQEIHQAFGAGAYDDLGNDSMIGSYKSNIKLGENYTQPRIYDVEKNYKVFASALDSIYGTKKGQESYTHKAGVIADKFSQYVSDFRTKNAAAFAKKKILIVRPNEKLDGQTQAKADNIAIWTPLAYNLFYGSASNGGLGMQFPQPNEQSWPKSTEDGGYFDPWAINTRDGDKKGVSGKLVEEYENKADIVIYLTNNTAWGNDTTAAKAEIQRSDSSVMKLLKDKDSKHIYFGDYSTFYRGMYGILGQEAAIGEMFNDKAFSEALGSALLAPAAKPVTIPSQLDFLRK